ncbi:hypothetical protein LYSHEL_27860 [Lysobacter helvus]|uniref:Transmembrane repetitive protein n=2 Tax=Lysobacteraceae TaxID=32033 RepID=A0ABM7Q8J3_9GAMM|nr:MULTISPECIES: hypothetical protein [Lysobacter]BCT93759.1 hypothetical protein LYSCAS_27830 [Lysobacter caseinilyticus]BCT96915.1 hypothetical protein LYSHEL_27860 [Lysobacter helvus]
MFNAADVIEALAQRRRLKSIRPEAPGTLPPGWQTWLDGMSTSPRAIKGAPPQDVIAEFAQRPLASPPKRMPTLTRWQAFRTLLRQQWNPPHREERGQRLFAAFVSGALHAVFLVLLMILAWVRIPPPPAGSAGETVVQVEFIGKGTPEETGGGAPEGPAPEPSPAPAAPAAQSAAEKPAETTQTPPPSEAQPTTEPPTEPAPVAAQPEVEPTPVEPQPAAQPLQVTEVTVPDTTFVLAPTRPRDVQLPEPQIVVPELKQPAPGVARVAVPQQQVLQVEQVAPTPVRVAPTLRAEEEARLSQARALNAPTTTPELQVPTVRAQVQALPMPSRGTQPSAQSGTAPAASASPTGTSTAATPGGGPPSPGSGTRPAAQTGTGTTPSAKPGAWPTPQRGDDFGVGTRNRPGAAPGTPGAQAGGKPGLFKADGTPNLGEAPSPQRNAPGTPEAQAIDLDKAGRWLKRPPYDYTPTAFDKYWRPSETLLQEWVRKGIKKLEIPIPGTGKRISCVVSLLAVGGACGLTDPNHNEQPATARPPPDIPFKPQLQENNGSVRPAPAPPATTVRPPAAG